jgi:glycosyltransferase involved in cell wall biosynthesis
VINNRKECKQFDEFVTKLQTKNFLDKISNPKFRLLLHMIFHLNRIPTDEEWEFVKRISHVEIGSIPDCDRWSEFIILQDSNISIRFISGIGIDVSKLRYANDKSGIPLVSSAVIDLVNQKSPQAVLIDFNPNIAALGTIGETNINFKNEGTGSFSRVKNRKFRNILLSGLYASVREIKLAMPELYALLLKAIPRTYLKSKLFNSKQGPNDFVIEIPLNLTLISVFPILNKQSIYQIKLFKECGLIQILPIIHDVLPITFPQYFPENTFEGSYDYLKLMSDQKNVFFVSSHVRDEFQKVFPHNSVINKYVFNLPNLLGKNLLERANEIDLEAKFKKVPYILTISTIEPRKNHLNLLLALQDIFEKEKNLKLILLGGYGWKNQFIMKILSSDIFSSRIEVIRNVSEAEKIALIKGSLFTVYPSMHEGFGLPILESLLLSKRVLFHNQKPMLDFENFPGARAIDMNNINLLQETLLFEIGSQETINDSKQIMDWLISQKNSEFLELLTGLNSKN